MMGNSRSYARRVPALFLLLLAALFLASLYVRSWSGTHKASKPDGLRTPRKQPQLLLNRLPVHPLDPLTFQEISAVQSILSSHPPFAAPNTLPSIHSITLQEPNKVTVLAWRNGDPLPPRRASVMAYSIGCNHVLIVDIASRTVLLHDVDSRPSAYPTLLDPDLQDAQDAATSDPDFVRYLRLRGFSTADIFCTPVSAGWFGPQEEGRRLCKVLCYVLQNGSSPNYFMRPVEGLTALVDMDAKRVVRITDNGRGIPVPNGDGTDYRYETE